jgi:hypothetical protein
MSVRAAIDCDRCRKKDCPDYATVTVDTEAGGPAPLYEGRFHSLHFCGACVTHTARELANTLPYQEQIKRAGFALQTLIQELTPASRKQWAERFLKPLPGQAGEEAADPSQGITERDREV